MKILLDTSIIVDVDRGEPHTINLCKKLCFEHEVYISTVTVSEILTGAYLRRDFKRAVAKAKRILGQFSWVELDGEVAEKIAQLNSHLLAEGSPIEYQDVAISASFLLTNAHYLLTRNKEHFKRIPALKEKALTPEEFIQNVLHEAAEDYA